MRKGLVSGSRLRASWMPEQQTGSIDQWLMAEVTTSRFSPALTTKMRDGVVVFASPRIIRVFHRDRGRSQPRRCMMLIEPLSKR
jgi:hypothetical protein